jgi:hypothetical protein
MHTTTMAELAGLKSSELGDGDKPVRVAEPLYRYYGG